MLGPDRPRFGGKYPGAIPTAGSKSAEGLTAQQWAAVRAFVARVGGIENARSALELLAILSAAGHAKDAA
jgi:hypothetical protein